MKKAAEELETNYLQAIYKLETYLKLANSATKILKRYRKKNKFDTIVFTGSSGAALAYVLSYKCKIPLVCVRKENDGSHYKKLTEGVLRVKRYLIVDDFISSGKTIRRILNTMAAHRKDSECVGIMLWNNSSKYDRSNFIYYRKSIPTFGCHPDF